MSDSFRQLVTSGKGFKSLRSLHFHFQALTQITLLSYNIQLQQF